MAPRIHEYTEYERGRIIELHAQGKKKVQIAAELNISDTGVGSFLRHWQRTGTISDKPRSGRPKSLAPEEVRKMFTGLKRGTVNNAADIMREPTLRGKKKPCKSTILKTLKEADAKVHHQELKPALTSAQRKARVKFAEKWRTRTVDEWKKVVFSDEGAIPRFPKGNPGVVILPKGYPFTPRLQKKTASHGGGEVKLWAAICSEGILAWQLYEGDMTASKYRGILKKNLIRRAEDYFEDEEWIFQQDGDPSHTATSTIEYLETHHNLTLMAWPSSSPDLNIIENLWSYMNGILARQEPARSMKEHTARVVALCEEMTGPTHKDFFQKLYDSLPKRMEEVIARKGYPTHY
jgi:hypothetical protein